MDKNQMLSVTPFMAEADFNEGLGHADLREVQVVGIVEGADRLRWVCIETVDGWEFPRLTEAVRWRAEAKQ